MLEIKVRGRNDTFIIKKLLRDVPEDILKASFGILSTKESTFDYSTQYPSSKKYTEKLISNISPYKIVSPSDINRDIKSGLSPLNPIKCSKCENITVGVIKEILPGKNFSLGLKIKILPNSINDFLKILDKFKCSQVLLNNSELFNAYDPKFKIVYENISSEDVLVTLLHKVIINEVDTSKFEILFSLNNNYSWERIENFSYCIDCDLGFFQDKEKTDKQLLNYLIKKIGLLESEIGYFLSIVDFLLQKNKGKSFLFIEFYKEEDISIIRKVSLYLESLGYKIYIIKYESIEVRKLKIYQTKYNLEDKNLIIFSNKELEKKLLNFKNSTLISLLNYLPLIRKLYVTLPLAKAQGLSPSDLLNKENRKDLSLLSWKGLTFYEATSGENSIEKIFSFFSFIPYFSKLLKVINDFNLILSPTIFPNSRDRLSDYLLGTRLKNLSPNDLFLFTLIGSWEAIIKKNRKVVFDGVLESFSSKDSNNIVKYIEQNLMLSGGILYLL